MDPSTPKARKVVAALSDKAKYLFSKKLHLGGALVVIILATVMLVPLSNGTTLFGKLVRSLSGSNTAKPVINIENTAANSPKLASSFHPANIEYDGNRPKPYGVYEPGNLTNSNVSGVDLILDWADVETAQGQYNWGPADKLMSDWVAKGKRFNIIVRFVREYKTNSSCSPQPQFLPTWEIARIPTRCRSGGAVIPDYFSPVFKADYLAYVTAIATHIAQGSFAKNLEYVRIGVGEAGEGYPCISCSASDQQTLAQWGYTVPNWAAWQKSMLSAYGNIFSYATVIYPLGDSDIDPSTHLRVDQEVADYAAANGMGVGQQGLVDTPGYANSQLVKIMQAIRKNYPNAYTQFQTNTTLTGTTQLQNDINIAENAGAFSIEWYNADSINPAYQQYFAEWQKMVNARTCGTSCSPNPPSSIPIVTLSANPAQVAAGSASTLTWSSTNATSCTASGAWSGNKPTSGSATTGAITANSTYTLTCSGAGGSASAGTTVSINTSNNPGPSVTLTALPKQVASGMTSTLTWSSTNATSCTASGAWSGNKPTSGSATTGAITANSTYTLTCSNSAGSVSASATVDVSNSSHTSISDTFHRHDQIGWSVATSGQEWSTVHAANSAAFSIAADRGVVEGDGSNAAIIGDTINSGSATVTGSLTSLNNTKLGLLANFVDDNNWYMAAYNGSNFEILKRNQGAYSSLGTVPYNATSGTAYTIRFQTASGHRLAAKIWKAGDVEPSQWLLQATDDAHPSGVYGVRAVLANGAKAAIDNFTVTTP